MKIHPKNIPEDAGTYNWESFLRHMDEKGIEFHYGPGTEIAVNIEFAWGLWKAAYQSAENEV